MTHDRSRTAVREAIEHRIDTVFNAAQGNALDSAADVMIEQRDRWYGRVVVRSYESAIDSVDSEVSDPAAAALEFFYGYYWIRTELLVQMTDAVPHSLNQDPTASLLAGDYLHSAAFWALCESDDQRLSSCFEILTKASLDIIEVFNIILKSSLQTADQVTLIEKTDGIIGETAARIGATLAGCGDPDRKSLARIGRSLSVARKIQRVLDPADTPVRMAPPEPDEQLLRKHADKQLSEAHQALRALSPAVDTGPLKTLVVRDDALTIDDYLFVDD